MMFTQTETVEQQYIMSLSVSTGCTSVFFSLTSYDELLKLIVTPTEQEESYKVQLYIHVYQY